VKERIAIDPLFSSAAAFWMSLCAACIDLLRHA
jgi:hypothetical protein